MYYVHVLGFLAPQSRAVFDKRKESKRCRSSWCELPFRSAPSDERIVKSQSVLPAALSADSLSPISTSVCYC